MERKQYRGWGNEVAYGGSPNWRCAECCRLGGVLDKSRARDIRSGRSQLDV